MRAAAWYSPAPLIVAAVLLLVLLYVDPCSAQGTGQNRVIQLGNPLKATPSGIDDLPEEGVIFLMNDVILTEGVVFAFSAFFRKVNQVSLQIWRPVQQGNANAHVYKLLFEMKVIPTVSYLREDMYIESKEVLKCIRVKENDRLGVHLKMDGSVGYVFDPIYPEALSHSFKDTDPAITINDTISFDELKFPYDFSLAAYIDTDLSIYPTNQTEQECPRGLIIPEHLRPPLPTLPTPPPRVRVTGIPGATGEAGPKGIPGEVGPDGRPGPAGAPGPAGPAGSPGSVGPMGPDGPAGPQGARGEQGIDGLPGVKGPKGVRGDQGEVGEPGPKGVPGKIVEKEDPEYNAVLAASIKARDPQRIKIIVVTVWLIAISVAIVVLVIVIIVIKRREQRRRPYRRERLPSAGSDFKPSWMEVLGEEESQAYGGGGGGKQASSAGRESISPDNLPGYDYNR